MCRHTNSGEKVISEREIRLMMPGKHNESVIRQALKKTVIHNIDVETITFIQCTAIGNLGHCLNQDCATITIRLTQLWRNALASVKISSVLRLVYQRQLHRLVRGRQQIRHVTNAWR